LKPINLAVELNSRTLKCEEEETFIRKERGEE
jgi:hypothetical protein